MQKLSTANARKGRAYNWGRGVEETYLKSYKRKGWIDQLIQNCTRISWW